MKNKTFEQNVMYWIYVHVNNNHMNIKHINPSNVKTFCPRYSYMSLYSQNSYYYLLKDTNYNKCIKNDMYY